MHLVARLYVTRTLMSLNIRAVRKGIPAALYALPGYTANHLPTCIRVRNDRASEHLTVKTVDSAE